MNLMSLTIFSFYSNDLSFVCKTQEGPCVPQKVYHHWSKYGMMKLIIYMHHK